MAQYNGINYLHMVKLSRKTGGTVNQRGVKGSKWADQTTHRRLRFSLLLIGSFLVL